MHAALVECCRPGFLCRPTAMSVATPVTCSVLLTAEFNMHVLAASNLDDVSEVVAGHSLHDRPPLRHLTAEQDSATLHILHHHQQLVTLGHVCTATQPEGWLQWHLWLEEVRGGLRAVCTGIDWFILEQRQQSPPGETWPMQHAEAT